MLIRLTCAAVWQGCAAVRAPRDRENAGSQSCGGSLRSGLAQACRLLFQACLVLAPSTSMGGLICLPGCAGAALRQRTHDSCVHLSAACSQASSGLCACLPVSHGPHGPCRCRCGADCLGKWAGDAERHLRLLFDEVRLVKLLVAAWMLLLLGQCCESRSPCSELGLCVDYQHSQHVEELDAASLQCLHKCACTS